MWTWMPRRSRKRRKRLPESGKQSTVKRSMREDAGSDPKAKAGGNPVRSNMLRDITLGQYYQTESVIHRMDPRVKLGGTLLFIISLFFLKITRDT